MANEKKTKTDAADTALAQIINRYMPYIQNMAGSLQISGLDRDDLVQEGLIGLFNALNSYDTTRNVQFSTFATTCINNGINTALRQAARKKNIPLNNYLSLDGEETEAGDPGYSPEELAIAAEEYAALASSIESLLSKFEKEALTLHLEGYDYHSSAKRLGTTAKAVDNALQRARKKLKNG